jgi:anionic cell wall polymer biosynthesis LytR-Cps2A-Psr (LCP) family protein
MWMILSMALSPTNINTTKRLIWGINNNFQKNISENNYLNWPTKFGA